MINNPLKDSSIWENCFDIGMVSRKMVGGRAEELATINGDWLNNVSAADFEKVRQESTGKTDLTAQEAILDSAPESERCDPVPGSSGPKAQVASKPDLSWLEALPPVGPPFA